MKKLSISSWQARIAAGFSNLRSQRLFQDKLSLSILVPTLLVNLLNLVVLAWKVHPTEVLVPVRYSSLEGFNSLGHWYQLYLIVGFAVAVTMVNTAMATLSFGRSRITSFFLLSGSFVVAMFCLVISAAFAVIV